MIEAILNSADGGYEEVRVLDCWQFLNKGLVRCWGTKWSCIHEKGLDKSYIADKYGFLWLTTVDTNYQ